jgi:hypothetical protein
VVQRREEARAALIRAVDKRIAAVVASRRLTDDKTILL